MIVIDDLHWADAGSLKLLRFVAREVRTVRLSIIVTYRPRELATAAEPDVIADIGHDAELVELSGLSGLSRDEAARIVGARDPTTVEALHERTGGRQPLLRG